MKTASYSTLEETTNQDEQFRQIKFPCYICQAGFVEETELTKHEQMNHSQQINDGIKDANTPDGKDENIKEMCKGN